MACKSMPQYCLKRSSRPHGPLYWLPQAAGTARQCPSAMASARKKSSSLPYFDSKLAMTSSSDSSSRLWLWISQVGKKVRRSCPARAWASAAIVTSSLLPEDVMKSSETSTLFCAAQACTCLRITSLPCGTQWSQKPTESFPAAPAVRICTNGNVLAAANCNARRRDIFRDMLMPFPPHFGPSSGANVFAPSLRATGPDGNHTPQGHARGAWYRVSAGVEGVKNPLIDPLCDAWDQAEVIVRSGRPVTLPDGDGLVGGRDGVKPHACPVSEPRLRALQHAIAQPMFDIGERGELLRCFGRAKAKPPDGADLFAARTAFHPAVLDVGVQAVQRGEIAKPRPYVFERLADHRSGMGLCRAGSGPALGQRGGSCLCRQKACERCKPLGIDVFGNNRRIFAGIFRRFLEAALPLHEGVVGCGERDERDGGKVILHRKERRFESIAQPIACVIKLEQSLAGGSAVLKDEIADASDGVCRPAVFDLAAFQGRMPGWQAVEVPHGGPDVFYRGFDDAACVGCGHGLDILR